MQLGFSDGGGGQFHDDVTALLSAVRTFDEEAFSGPSCQGICGGRVLQSHVNAPVRTLTSSWDAPTPHERSLIEVGLTVALEIVERANTLFAQSSILAERLRASGSEVLEVPEPVSLPR